MKTIVNYINEAKVQEIIVKFNIAELTLMYNALMSKDAPDNDMVEDLADYVTDRFYKDEFDIEEELWVEYKDKTKAAGRSDKYNDNDRNKRNFKFNIDEANIFVDIITKQKKTRDDEYNKIADQVLRIFDAALSLGNGQTARKVKNAVNEHPDYVVGLSRGLDYKRGSQSTYPEIKSFTDLQKTIEWAANCEVTIDDKEKKIKVHAYSLADME